MLQFVVGSRRSRLHRANAFASLVRALAAVVAAAAAQGALAACPRLPFHQTAPIVERFVLDRRSLLRDHPQGGERLENEAAALALEGPLMVSALIGALPAANQAQKRAIGAGLADAGLRCARPEPQVLASIERALRNSRDLVAVEEFNLKLKIWRAAQDAAEVERRKRSLAPFASAPSDESGAGRMTGAWRDQAPQAAIPEPGATPSLPSIRSYSTTRP
jgi:hypothetical protein